MPYNAKIAPSTRLVESRDRGWGIKYAVLSRFVPFHPSFGRAAWRLFECPAPKPLDQVLIKSTKIPKGEKKITSIKILSNTEINLFLGNRFFFRFLERDQY